MGEALSGTDIRPVSEPRVQFFEGDDKIGYKMEMRDHPGIRPACLRRHRGRGGAGQGDG